MSSFVALRIHQGCEVHVLTIHKDHQVAGEVIDRAMRYLGHHQVNAHRQMHITTHDTGDFILNKVTELRAELLVMGAYGKSGLKEFFFGSVTKNLLKHCPVPILLDH